MPIYNEAITDNSVWLSATPNDTVKKLPFCITEIGHFFAMREYAVERETHDSLLFIFTLKGAGEVTSKGASFEVGASRACVIDCRQRHKYCSKTDEWEFIWFHFGGAALECISEVLENNLRAAVRIADDGALLDRLSVLMKSVTDASLMSGFEISALVHDIMNMMIASELSPAKNTQPHYDDIEAAARFIRENYAYPITVDDIISQVHISKYHFIRLFRRFMGASPYSYITDCRINHAKILLRSSSDTVEEVALKCGFADTSNFISRFKSRTGCTPMGYRKDFLLGSK